ncbi:hypothetical protein [Streptomyces sp. UC4497]
MFAAGIDNAEVAKRLRDSVRSTRRWHRARQARGDTSLYSTGSVARPKRQTDHQHGGGRRASFIRGVCHDAQYVADHITTRRGYLSYPRPQRQD